MTGPMLRVGARGLWMRRRRLLGMVAAVFLGVAFLSGTLSLSATMSGAIDTAITTAYQGTSVIVRNATATQRSPGAPRGPVSGSVLTSVWAAPGVASADGEVAGFGELMGSTGKPVTGLGPRAAGNWLADPLLNPWHLVSAAARLWCWAADGSRRMVAWSHRLLSGVISSRRKSGPSWAAARERYRSPGLTSWWWAGGSRASPPRRPAMRLASARCS